MPHRREDPVFPYGAVYFRKSNPPEEDWARDHQTAAKVGMNNFRHWFMWSAVEVAPDKFDWRDYDRMMDLAAKTASRSPRGDDHRRARVDVRQVPHARYQASDDSIIHSQISGSSAIGGFPGLCLDNEDVRVARGAFPDPLVERYKDPSRDVGLGSVERAFVSGRRPPRMLCYCDATQKKFREWLKAKYGTLENLGKAWYRYSYASWDNVHPPRSFGGYPESLDWLRVPHRRSVPALQNGASIWSANWTAETRWSAHGVAGSLEALPGSANNEWRSAAEVDVWGFTWVASRKGSEPWKQFHAVDLVRAGSRGKPFWHAEAQAGPLWMQPQVPGRAREDGRITDEKDVRIWNLISMAGGATGILYPRWRPSARWSAVWCVRSVRHGRQHHASRGDDGQMARWANRIRRYGSRGP